MSIRYAAILIIMIKFINISDVPLIIGQGLIVLTFTTYFALALSLCKSPRLTGEPKFAPHDLHLTPCCLRAEGGEIPASQTDLAPPCGWPRRHWQKPRAQGFCFGRSLGVLDLFLRMNYQSFACRWSTATSPLHYPATAMP